VWTVWTVCCVNCVLWIVCCVGCVLCELCTLSAGLGVLEEPAAACGEDQEGQKWGDSLHLTMQSVKVSRQSWECLGAGGDNSVWLRASAVVIDGIQLTGRSKSEVQAAPWELQLHNDTGYALHVAWVQLPGSVTLQLFVFDGCAQWSPRNSPDVDLDSPSMRAWHLCGEPTSSLGDKIVVVGVLLTPECVSSYGADPCRTVQLPPGTLNAQILPTSWLRRLVVLTRLEFGPAGSPKPTRLTTHTAHHVRPTHHTTHSTHSSHSTHNAQHT